MIGFLRTVLNRLTSSGTEQSSVGRFFLGARTPAGTFVNHDRSLQNATVWACVQYLTKAVAQLPWRVVRESNNGDIERVTSSPVDTMLNQRPNPEMGAFTWRQTMLGHALLWGNGYAEIQRDNAGRALYLWPSEAYEVDIIARRRRNRAAHSRGYLDRRDLYGLRYRDRFRGGSRRTPYRRLPNQRRGWSWIRSHRPVGGGLMAMTPILGITELASNQNQKEITINNMVVALEAAGNAVLNFIFTANAKTLSASDYTQYVCFTASTQTATATLTVPLTRRLFLVHNGNATYDIVVGGTTGTTVTVPAQSMLLILCDGTNCRTLAVDATGAVTSVLGEVGVVTLPDLVGGGLAPADDPTFTGTVDASGADAVLVPDPTLDGEAASKGYVDIKTWDYAALPADVQAVPIPFAFSGLPLAGQVLHIPLVIRRRVEPVCHRGQHHHRDHQRH